MEKIKNGPWIKFEGAGDERSDMGGYGDVILILHFGGMPEPEILLPELCSTYQADFDFRQKQLVQSVVGMGKRITKMKAASGDAVWVTIRERD